APDHRIVHLVVGGVAPPDQHVGLAQRLFGAAMFGLLQRRGPDADIGVLAQQGRKLVMHPLGVVFGNGPILLFMDVFAPDQGTDRHDDISNSAATMVAASQRRPSRRAERTGELKERRPASRNSKSCDQRRGFPAPSTRSILSSGGETRSVSPLSCCWAPSSRTTTGSSAPISR